MFLKKKKNLSLGHILDILLKFRNFRAQYFYVKREIFATNHGVFNLLVLIAHAAIVFYNLSRKGNSNIYLALIVQSFCTQFTFRIDLFQLKMEISRNALLSLLRNPFMERYE